jgi:hypothetical protein
MKMTYDQKAAEERMKPGVLTATGFLGTDTRSLADIIAADEAGFRSLDLDFDAVADKLTYLAREGEKGLGEPTTIDGAWLVKSDESRGKIPCPFQDGIFHKNAVTVQRLDSSDRIIYTDLSIHLLREHHFCQGTNSFFRLDPDALKKVLKL